MTQNGPYPGRPPQPWSTGGAGEPYQQPADPWGTPRGDEGQDTPGWGGHPLSTPPGVDEPPTYPGVPVPGGGITYPGEGRYPGAAGDGFRPAGEHGQPPTSPSGWTPAPPPPRPRTRRVPLVALLALSGLLVCGGLGTTAWLLLREPDATAAVGGTAPAPTTAGPATAPTGIPGPPLSSKDARFVGKGQCVRNEGTADAPEMSISVCASGAYEVLARIDGRTTGEADAETKCAKVPSYSKWYFYDSELDSLDFVLCLKER